MGPLEATVKNLSKQISAKQESSERLQREWLADQTLLVAVANVVEEQTEKVAWRVPSRQGGLSLCEAVSTPVDAMGCTLLLQVHDMNAQYTLATQKQMRLDAAFAQQRTEVGHMTHCLPPLHAATLRLRVWCWLQIKQLQSGVEAMHKDMIRLNTLIARNEEMSKKLAESSYNLEKDFVAELKVGGGLGVLAILGCSGGGGCWYRKWLLRFIA